MAREWGRGSGAAGLGVNQLPSANRPDQTGPTPVGLAPPTPRRVNKVSTVQTLEGAIAKKSVERFSPLIETRDRDLCSTAGWDQD